MARRTQRDRSRVPSRSARTAGALAATTLLALGLAACSPGRASDGQSSPGTHAPGRGRVAGGPAGIADRTARFTMTMSAGSSIPFQESGSGAIDFTNDSAQIDMSVSVLSEKIHVTAVVVAGDVYEKLSRVPGCSGPPRARQVLDRASDGQASLSAVLRRWARRATPQSFLLALTRKGLKVTRSAAHAWTEWRRPSTTSSFPRTSRVSVRAWVRCRVRPADSARHHDARLGRRLRTVAQDVDECHPAASRARGDRCSRWTCRTTEHL